MLQELVLLVWLGSINGECIEGIKTAMIQLEEMLTKEMERASQEFRVCCGKIFAEEPQTVGKKNWAHSHRCRDPARRHEAAHILTAIHSWHDIWPVHCQWFALIFRGFKTSADISHLAVYKRKPTQIQQICLRPWKKGFFWRKILLWGPGQKKAWLGFRSSQRVDVWEENIHTKPQGWSLDHQVEKQHLIHCFK